MTRFKIVVLAAALCASAGCASYKNSFFKNGKAEGWTEKETKAAFGYADRACLSEPNEDGGYEVNYGTLDVGEVRKQMDLILQNLEAVLDYRNKDIAQFVDYFNLRAALEQDERIAEAVRARLRAVELEYDFKRLMGFSSSQPSWYREYTPGKPYDLVKMLSPKSFDKGKVFIAGDIESAKANGSLELVEKAWFVIGMQYGHKTSDPSNPEDENSFIWQPLMLGLKLHGYKILEGEETPKDNALNYIEGFRVFGEREESAPALKVFFPAQGRAAVVVIDGDLEGKDSGFGLPDFVEESDRIQNVADVLQDVDVIDRLFPQKEKWTRIPPKKKDFTVEIARVGEESDFWEVAKNAEGWKVPFVYRNESATNYNVAIKTSKPQNGSKTIEFVAKEWTGRDQYTPSAGSVVEYYRPKPEFAGKILEAKTTGNPQNVRIVIIDGLVVEGFIPPGQNKFIEDEPYAIAYTHGEKRWRIERDAGSKVFNKRKEISKAENRATDAL